MDEVEFEKYLLNSIVPLYPDAKNMPGHCVLLKVDSGPGRMSMQKRTVLGVMLPMAHTQQVTTS
jgi:hypothetical protein